MKISKLINELIAIKKEHGDHEVYAGDPDYGDGKHQVTQVCVEGENLHCTADMVAVLWHGSGSYCKECHRGCD